MLTACPGARLHADCTDVRGATDHLTASVIVESWRIALISDNLIRQ